MSHYGWKSKALIETIADGVIVFVWNILDEGFYTRARVVFSHQLK